LNKNNVFLLLYINKNLHNQTTHDLLKGQKRTSTNSLNEANQILDKLEDKGIDAAVIDRRRK
jgi:hypothetical protein